MMQSDILSTKNKWSWGKLLDFCDIQTGKKDVDEGNPKGEYVFFTCAYLPTKSDTYSFDGEHLILPGNGANVGECFYFDGKLEAYQRTYVLNNFRINPKFLYYYFQQNWKKHLHGQQLGSATNYILMNNFAEFKVPNPPIEVQEAVASLLARADRLRHLRRTAHDLGESLLQSVFLEMFYYSETKWEQALVEDLAKKKNNAIRTGPFGSQLLHSEFTETGDVLVLGIDNAVQNEFSWGKSRYITREKYEELKRYTVFPGDLIITIMATNGRVAVVPDNIPLAINTKHLCCITLEQKICLPKFLQACLLYHPVVLKQMGGSERGAVMPGLNMEIIKNLVVPVPPLSLQEEFAGVVARVESLRGRMSESERQVEGLFESLLSESFGGLL